MATERKAEPRKPGRPSKYREEFPALARKLTLIGLTIPKMAEFFEVGETTIDRWIIEHPEFRSAVKNARLEADSDVAHAMYRNACGFEYDEEVVSQGAIVTLKKYQPPNATAGIFWLTNRHPELWRRDRPPELDLDKTPAKPEPVTVQDASIPEPD